MLHDYLESRGVRGECEISFVLPLSTPEPPSSETSKALIAAPLLKEPMIRYSPLWRIQLPDQSVLSPVSITNTASRLARSLTIRATACG